MKIFSKEYTLKTKSEHGLYIGSIVYGAGGPFAFRKTYEHYKPCLKGGHTHNHQRNALERKLNRSKDSRNRCHNVLNKGYEYKFVLNRGNLLRVKYKIIGLDMAKQGERDMWRCRNGTPSLPT